MPGRIPPLEITATQAREFLLRATGLDHAWGTAAEAIQHMGYVQMDPIDVCGKMHDLILRNRISNYRPDDLIRSLYEPQPRDLFDHYIPQRGILVAMPASDHRFIVRAMQRRRKREGYGGALDAAQQKLARVILRRIKEEGPLGAADFANAERSQTGWGTTGTLAKTTLDKLFFHGRLLVSRREKFRRFYDLPERILPPEILAMRPASPREEKQWLVMERLRQRRLVRLSNAHRALVDKLIQPVRIEGAPPLYCLRDDAPTLEAPPRERPPLLLAPLDPIVYDRVITRAVWDFDYTWEVYTPPIKRLRGYYALPLIAEGAIIGHVDPRAERATGTLVARTNVRDEATVHFVLQDLMKFLGLSDIRIESTPN
jgi:uncharacterized protein YcaQ